MHEPVAHARFVDVAWLRVANFEMMVAAVLINARDKVSMKRNEVIHQISAEFLHICTLAFSFYEFLPCGAQVFERNDILVSKTP